MALFLALVVLNLVVGLHAIGALMVVGLMMLPAAAARFWSRRLPQCCSLAAALGALCVWLGLLLSYYANLPSGPCIVLLAGMRLPAVGMPRANSRPAAPQPRLLCRSLRITPCAH